VPESGEVIDLAPSTLRWHPGGPAPAVAHVTVDTGQVQRVVCVENLAAFYELIRCQGQGLPRCACGATRRRRCATS